MKTVIMQNTSRNTTLYYVARSKTLLYLYRKLFCIRQLSEAWHWVAYRRVNKRNWGLLTVAKFFKRSHDLQFSDVWKVKYNTTISRGNANCNTLIIQYNYLHDLKGSDKSSSPRIHVVPATNYDLISRSIIAIGWHNKPAVHATSYNATCIGKHR